MGSSLPRFNDRGFYFFSSKAQPDIIKESSCDYVFHGTGHTYCKGVTALLHLSPRFDLLTIALSFIEPIQDYTSNFAEFLPGKMDPFVLVVAPKSKVIYAI